jgi:hypothetical protein
MTDRPLRTPGVAGLCLFVALIAGTRIARAQGEADGGVPASGTPSTSSSPDAGAPAESGGGLFEQSQTAAAGTTATADSAAAAAKAPPFTINGYVRGTSFIGRVPDQNAAMMKANYGELSLQVRTAKTVYGDGFADARIRYGLQGDLNGTFVDMREAYVNTYIGPLDLRLGKQIIVWGRADALNPTNNLTPVDFRIRSPLEDDIRLGNVGARGNLRLGVIRVEGVWLPVFLPTELPPVALPQYVAFGAPRFPSLDLRNSLGAGRVHLELPAFDMSISYLRGFAPLPGLTLASLTFDPVTPSVLISRTAYDQQVIGFDFSTALGEVATIRGEAAYRRPFDYQNRPWAARPDLQYVLGADHNFGSFSVIAQYLGRYVFDWQKENGPTMPLDTNVLKMDPNDPSVDLPYWTEAATTAINEQLAKQNQILFSQTAKIQHIATLRFEWLLAHETLSLSSLCLYNFTTKEWLVTPRIGWKMNDALTAYVGAQVFAGPTDTLFGLIDQQLSAGYAELRFTY